jgi:RNA polymerase sigma-70 factor (ECF subfamily)
LIRRAASGSPDGREEFARCYAPVIRAYLGARWRYSPLLDQVDDATQQVFVDCFEDEGALKRVDEGRSAGFRAYLYGVVRNVARNLERARAQAPRQRGDSLDLDGVAADGESLARTFDRAWARAVLRRAGELQLERAKAKDPRAVRRHELLALRYGEDLPIREIARRWNVDADELHRQFRRAREEFQKALEAVVRDLHGGGPERVEAECRELLRHFS